MSRPSGSAQESTDMLLTRAKGGEVRVAPDSVNGLLPES